MSNVDLKQKLDAINEDIIDVKERIDLKKRIAEAKKERFFLKLGLNFKKKNDE